MPNSQRGIESFRHKKAREHDDDLRKALLTVLGDIAKYEHWRIDDFASMYKLTINDISIQRSDGSFVVTVTCSSDVGRTWFDEIGAGSTPDYAMRTDPTIPDEV